MNTVISMLLMIIYGSYTDSVEKDIALNLLLASERIESLSVSTLAEKCQCSPAVITRFIKKLGFDNFKRLKTQMALTKKVRMDQLKTHVEISPIEEIVKHMHSLIDRFDDHQLANEVREINAMLHDASRLIIIGAAYPQALCLHYAEDMLVMGKPVYTVPMGYKFNCPGGDDKTMYMIVTFTGRFMEYFRNEMQRMFDTHEKICVITSADLSSLEQENIKEITLPFHQDHESANSWFMELLRYMKTDYYHSYME